MQSSNATSTFNKLQFGIKHVGMFKVTPRKGPSVTIYLMKKKIEKKRDLFFKNQIQQKNYEDVEGYFCLS